VYAIDPAAVSRAVSDLDLLFRVLVPFSRERNMDDAVALAVPDHADRVGVIRLPVT
jgi:hypothetical protein